MSDIAARLAEVRERIDAAARRAGRAPHEITLVAVSKKQPVTAVLEAIAAGQREFGENYGQELVSKTQAVFGQPGDDTLRWHMIGHVQRNKIAMLAPHVALWQTLDRRAVIDSIAAHAPTAPALLQVNVGSDPAKAGCEPGDIGPLLEHAAGAGVRVVGLMTIPPVRGDPRPHFAALTALAHRHKLAEVSMGMSADFDVAVAEGATIVRVGEAIFGARTPPSSLQR